MKQHTRGIKENQKASLIGFTNDEGKESHFDYKDGKWQFWGDLEIDESAKMLFDAFSIHFTQETLKGLLDRLKSKSKDEG